MMMMKLSQEMAFNKKNGKTMSGFLKIRVFFKKSVLRKTAAFSVSDTGDPLILTCLKLEQQCLTRVIHPLL